jgi:hypothetical protein
VNSKNVHRLKGIVTTWAEMRKYINTVQVAAKTVVLKKGRREEGSEVGY